VARTKRHPNINFLVSYAVFVLVTYALLRERFGLIFLVPAWIFLLLTWAGFFMSTACGCETLRGHPCTKPARGKLGSCGTGSHGQKKRDAMWASAGLRNPGMLFRVMWVRQDAPSSTRMVGRSSARAAADSSAAEPAASTKRGAYDLSMWFLTAVSAIAAVVALLPK
jgi:hypothetical protein